MKLVLMRHGADQPVPGESNLRELSNSGKNDVIETAERLKEGFEGRTIRIVSSPVRRAKEAAFLVAAIVGSKSMALDSRLQPGRSIEECIDVVEQRKGKNDEDVLVVIGHIPTLNELGMHYDRWRSFDIQQGEFVVMDIR